MFKTHRTRIYINDVDNDYDLLFLNKNNWLFEAI